MRKFLIFVVIAILSVFAVSCSSCSDDSKFGIEYALNLNGHFNVDGAANFDFDWTNALKLENGAAYNLNNVLISNDAKIANAAARVDAWLNSEIKVTDFSGHYDLYIKSYVKETLTGLKFEIDRHITNLPETTEDLAQ